VWVKYMPLKVPLMKRSYSNWMLCRDALLCRREVPMIENINIKHTVESIICTRCIRISPSLISHLPVRLRQSNRGIKIICRYLNACERIWREVNSSRGLTFKLVLDFFPCHVWMRWY
jgi:hypothetical protein